MATKVKRPQVNRGADSWVIQTDIPASLPQDEEKMIQETLRRALNEVPTKGLRGSRSISLKVAGKS